MKKKLFLYFILLSLALGSTAQEIDKEKKKLKDWVKVGGFVSSSIFYDSRELGGAIDRQFMLYPAPVEMVGNIDINDQKMVTFLAVVSRLRADFFAPDILNAKLTGKIEFDFTLINDRAGVRFRHAYIKLDWEKSSLLMGRSWHPFFTEECFPQMMSINIGAPFQPFNRSAQLKYTYKTGYLKLMAAVSSQMDYPSPGPMGPEPEYMRWALVPEFIGQISYEGKNASIGVVGEVKTIKPRNYTEGTGGTFSTSTTLTTPAIKIFGRYKQDKVDIGAMGLWGKNMYDFLMPGGYGAISYDSTTGAETYASPQTISLWANFVYGNQLKFQVFGGYLRNLGANLSPDQQFISDRMWGRSLNIDNMYRIMPSITYQIKKLMLGLEYEHTTVGYGDVSLDGSVVDAENVNGTRISFHVRYFF